MGVMKINQSLLTPSVTSQSGIALSSLKAFTSNGQTGTGSSQNIAHGLGVVPTFVLGNPTDGGTLTYGSHDATNIKVTCSSTKKFDIIAFV